jgi:hypothetical protein
VYPEKNQFKIIITSILNLNLAQRMQYERKKPISKESSFHEAESIRSTANAPTAPPSPNIYYKQWLQSCFQKKGSSISSSPPNISRSKALEKSRPPTLSPMTLQPSVSLHPTTSERNVSISSNTAAPNSSSIVQSSFNSCY